METKERLSRFMAILLSLCMVFTMMPMSAVTAFAAGDADARSVEADVLIFSTYLTSRTGNERYVKAARENIPEVFEEEGYTVREKIEIREEKHLTEEDMAGIGLLILFFPYRSCSDEDIALMREFLQSGGRIVMIGENGRFTPTENTVLTETAEKLGGSFQISTQAVGSLHTIKVDSEEMPETSLTENLIYGLSCNYVAPISYTGSVQPVLYYEDDVWAVDQAAEMGRIFAISDINCFDGLKEYKESPLRADTEQWILNWLLDARDNQGMVAEYKDPNLGFGGSPAVTVSADTHVSVAGDYSFTVTYEAQDDRTMDAKTIGTDDVTVTDADGNELVIGSAEILTGKNGTATTVRYTVEAQNPGIFTAGEYTISIVNAGVADSGGYQVGGKTETFHVSELPVEITGPGNISVPLNGSASLSVSTQVSGAEEQGPFDWSYQWYRRSGGSYELIQGAEEAVYQIPENVTGQAGEYVYRCECTVTTEDGVSVTLQSKDAVVTVQRGVSIGTPTASEGDGTSWSLSAKLLEAGSETITETGFVWGIMGSPTLALNNGQAQTVQPVTEQNGTITVTADNLATGVSYYARAYAKTSGGSVTYSTPVSFGSTGNLGSFSVTNNGDNTFTVTLTGGKGDQMVYYRTVNGSAVGGTHFEHQSGVLTFESGETKKTITVTEYGVNSAYNNNAATGYANAERTYSLELYRTMGGASIDTDTATADRNMGEGRNVDRNIFGDFVKTVAGNNHNHGDYDDDKRGWTSDGRYYAAAFETVSVTSLLTTPAYWRNLSTAQVQFRMYFEAAEENSGYQHIQIASGEGIDLKYYPYNGDWRDNGPDKGGSARYYVTFEHGASGLNHDYRNYSLPAHSGNDTSLDDKPTRWTETWLNGGDAAGNSCVVLPNGADSLTVSYAASGSSTDKWTTRNESYKLRVSDTREPQLLAVAPMAQTAYAAGENITIALIFDEIVDSNNSDLSKVSINTNLTGTLSYAGGADTNVLYFTGQVTSAFDGGEIQVTGINGTENIKDMASDTSTPTDSSSSGETTINLGGTSAPTVSISDVTVNGAEASAMVEAENASVLKYCWTDSQTMPAAGWLNADNASSVTLTNTMAEAGKYYLHAMAINTATGEADYDYASFTIEDLLYLEASADNTSWAQSRIIMLESSGEGSIEVRTPGGRTETLSASVTSYTAMENGTYTFTLKKDGKTVEKRVTVDKIDNTAPVVSFSSLPEGWQQQFPAVTISGEDGSGAAASGITSLKYKLVTEKGEYPAEGLLEAEVSGGKVDSQTISGEDAVNGLNYIYYIAQDAAGNTIQGYSSAIRVDGTVPTIDVEASVSEGSAAMFKVTATFGVSGGDVAFRKQSEEAVYPVSGNTQEDGDGRYTFTAEPGVSEEGTYTFTVTTGAGKTVTVNAPEICRITLNANGGSFDPEDPDADTDTWLVVEGGHITPPEGDNQQTPERKGYTLKGWYTGQDLQTEYDSAQTVSGTMTLYAGWELDNYTISYELGGGSFGDDNGNPESYTVESEAITLKNPSKDGHIFLGWSGTELEEIQKEVVIPKGSVGDRSYTANWTQVEVIMEGWTYGEEPAEPEFGEGSNPGGGEVTYTYYTDEACTLQTTPAENGAEENGGKPVYAGTYYVKAEVAAANGYNAASGKASFTIQQKTIGIQWEDTELTYTGIEQAPTAIATGLVDGDSCRLTVKGAMKDTNAKVGNEFYTAEVVSVDNRNYKLPEEGLTQSFTIVPAELKITWSDTELTYSGEEQKPTATPTGMVNGETVAVSISGGQVNANTQEETYTATASVSDKNYVIKEGSETISFTIKPKTITEEMVSLSGGTLKGDSYEYKFTKENITPAVDVADSGKNLVKETDYILSGDTTETAYGNYTLIVNGQGNYTGTVDVKWNITDPNAPAATISIDTNQWNTFWNTVTFGHFFKDTQKVTVSGTDGENESGVKDVFYYMTETPVVDPAELSGVEWTEIDNNGSFSIEPNRKLYIYAKVTDNAGNTVIVNSDGIVVYTDAAQVIEEMIFTRLGDNDLIADVELNGNTVKEIKCGGSELTYDEDYTVDQNTGAITFQNNWLKTLDAGEYTLTVSYNPMGVEYVSGNGNDEPATTSIALSVQKAAGSVTELSDISKIYDGKVVPDITYSTHSTGSVKVEYKVRSANDNTYTTTKPSAVGEYTVRVTAAADDDYNEASATKDFAITYMDAPNPAYTLSGTEGTGGWYTSDVTIIPPEGYTVSSSLNSEYSDILTISAREENVTIYLKNEKGQMTDAISVGEIKIDKDDPYIAATGNTEDYLTDDTAKITVSDSTSGVAKVEAKKDNGEFTDITSSYDEGYSITENGIYTFRVTDNAGRTNTATLEYTRIDAQTPVVTINATHGGQVYTGGMWTNKDITLIPENETNNLGDTTYQYRVDGGDWYDYIAPIIISSDTDVDGTVYLFKAKSTSGIESDTASITVKRDTVLPDGDITIKENSVKKLINKITFGLFFNENVDVTITGTDALSNVDSIQYYRSEEILDEDEVISLEDWVPYDSSIHETAVDAEKFIYYVKITDKAGNATLFGSNGVTFDLTAPAVTGVNNGSTYYTTQKISVADINLDTVTLNEEPVTLENGVLTLNGNTETTYTIVATDKADNTTTVTITMKTIASLSEDIDDLTSSDVTSADKGTVDDVKNAADSVDTENATEEEKAELEEILNDCETLLDKIDEVEQELSGVTDGIGNFDPDSVKTSDTETIEDLVDRIDDLLNGGNLTEEEKEALETVKEDAEDLLDKIDKTAGAGNTENIQNVQDITPDNVKTEDKEDLESAKEDIQQALEDYAGNYTEDEKKQLEETLEQIEESLEVIKNVEDSEEAITDLPDSVSPDNIQAEEQIDAAKKQYDALSDYEKSLVSDEAIAKLNILLAQLVDYRIIEGDGSVWTNEDTEGLTFVANGAYSKFTGVEIDGTVLDTEDYTVSGGSTVLTLKPAYLDTLAAGEHTITILYADGDAAGTFTVEERSAGATKTGDNSHMMAWTMLMLIMGGAVLTLDFRRRNKRA